MEENVTLEQLFSLIDKIRIRGDIFILKFDGERENNVISVYTSNPKGENSIKYEGNDLQFLLSKVVKKYFENEL